MSWNRSDSRRTAPVEEKGTAKSRMRGAVAGGAVVVLACAVAYWIFRPVDGGVETAAGAKSRMIREVSPSVSTAAQEKVVYRTKEERYFAETNGLAPGKLARWWLDHRPPAGYTNDSTRTRAKQGYEIFEHRCDNSLAFLLTVRPGDTIVGDAGYDRWFTRAFLESLKTPIIVTKDDTPEQAALKRLVIETKADLKGRLDAGEDIAQIMSETRRELQKLSALKSDLRRELYAMKRDGTMTEENMQDYVDAANKMLADKGIAPLKFGPLIGRNLKRQIEDKDKETK